MRTNLKGSVKVKLSHVLCCPITVLVLMCETYIVLRVSKNKVIFAHSFAVYHLDVSSGNCLLQ